MSNKVTTLSAEQKGRNVFVAKCVRCHKSIPEDITPLDQESSGMKPPVLGGISYKYSIIQFKKILNKGPRYMPSFSALADKEKEDIYAFLNSIEVNRNLLQPKKRKGCGMN